MDYNKNYYLILDVSKDSTLKKIKSAYYKNAKIFHPDKNGKESDPKIFSEMTEAYDVLMDDKLRFEYDKKSKFGKDYNEIQELFIINSEFDYHKENIKLEDFKKNQILNIIELVDDTFNGTIEYNRWVICKKCNGTGKDTTSKLFIKDEFGNIKGVFDSDEGCDFCEGTGKDHWENKCGFCFGQGKIGSNDCSSCNGDKRILGKQKLSKIKLDKDKEETTIQHMGHFSKQEPGKVGNLILKKSVTITTITTT